MVCRFKRPSAGADAITFREKGFGVTLWVNICIQTSQPCLSHLLISFAVVSAGSLDAEGFKPKIHSTGTVVADSGSSILCWYFCCGELADPSPRPGSNRLNTRH